MQWAFSVFQDIPGFIFNKSFLNSLFSTALKGAFIATRDRVICNSVSFWNEGDVFWIGMTVCFIFVWVAPNSVMSVSASLLRPLQDSQWSLILCTSALQVYSHLLHFTLSVAPEADRIVNFVQIVSFVRPIIPENIKFLWSMGTVFCDKIRWTLLQKWIKYKTPVFYFLF